MTINHILTFLLLKVYRPQHLKSKEVIAVICNKGRHRKTPLYNKLLTLYKCKFYAVLAFKSRVYFMRVMCD